MQGTGWCRTWWRVAPCTTACGSCCAVPQPVSSAAAASAAAAPPPPPPPPGGACFILSHVLGPHIAHCHVASGQV